MTSVVDKYYRKISENIDNLKIKFDISSLLVKSKEHDSKIENIYNKDHIDINFLVKSEIDKKDNNILNNINNNFYTKQDVLNITSQYYLKKYLYDKNYIDNNFLVKSEIDKKDNNILDNINNNFYSRSYINDNYLLKLNIYDKNDINLKFNDLYNKKFLDLKFDNIYNKTEVDNKINKLDRNIVLFNQNLTKFIDESYKEGKKSIEDDISNLENSKITDNEKGILEQLTNIDLNKINSSYNLSVFNKVKLNKMRYYISEFIPFNITLVKKFTFIGNINEISILQFELDQRIFDIDDLINFFLNITIQYDNSKSNWYRLKLKLDVLYDDDTLIKSFVKMPISKGFLYQHLMNYNINRFLKLSKKTEKIILKIYMSKINTSLQDNVIFNLNQAYENDYCDLIHYKIV